MSTALCVAIAGVTATPSATAAAAPLPLLRLAPDEAPGSVLGLDGKDANASNTLTNALRKAFANRGISGGEEISLEEMRLTMGCSNDEVACLAEGGKTLGVRRLVFGYLKPTGGGTYQLDIQILDVQTGQLEAQATVAVTKAELGADQVDAKANAIVGQLMPAEDAGTDLPPRPVPLPETDDTQEDEVQEEPPPPREGKYYLGLEKPTPRWKWAAFATSLSLTALAGGATIGMAVWLTAKNAGFRGKLLDLADESGQDGNPLNDVDKRMSGDLCEFAAETPNPQQPDAVRNAKISKLCADALVVQDVQRGVGIGTAVLGAATLVFTGVLLIHKRKPTAEAMLRHGVHMGVGPGFEGGVTFSGGLRF